MTTHPVHFRVHSSPGMARIHVLIRLLLLMALGALGWSGLYFLAYLAVPAMVALLISQKGGPGYLTEDAPRITRALTWMAHAYAYLWLLTDSFPSSAATSVVELQIEPGPAPTMRLALLRVVYSIPALLLLALLSCVASVLWMVGAILVLVRGCLPHVIADFLELTLRYQFRLMAWHLSLVDRYPSLGEGVEHAVPGARAL